MAPRVSKSSKKKSPARDFEDEINETTSPADDAPPPLDNAGLRSSSSEDDDSAAGSDDDALVTPNSGERLPPLKARTLDDSALDIGTHQDKSQYRQLKVAMTRISTLSEALKFAELYVQILRSGFASVAAIDASSVKAKQITDRLNERRVNLALTISSWDSDLQSVALNSWLGCMNWIDSKPAEKLFKDALIDSIRLVLATQFSSSGSCSIKKQQDCWDRIRKNRAPFYPKKLECSSELSSFLKALELVSPFTPQWDEVLSFKSSGKSYSIYRYLQFHSKPSVVSDMVTTDFEGCKNLIEGSFSLFLSLKASISTDILDRLELFSDQPVQDEWSSAPCLFNQVVSSRAQQD
jgi:hypothetical protein